MNYIKTGLVILAIVAVTLMNYIKTGLVVLAIVAVTLMTENFFDEKQGNQTQNLYPPTEDFKRATEQVVDEILPDKIFDILWKKIFHYQTFFESLDGFLVSSAGVAIANDQLTLTTGAVSGNNESIIKQPNNQGLITFSQPSRMRSEFQVGYVAAQTGYITIGNVPTAAQGYGFKIINGSLYGVTHNGTTETTVLLQSISVNQKYKIEARYLPGEKVIFLADDPTTSPATKIREVGVLTATLPSPAETANTNLFQIKITTNAAAEKILRVTFLEYLQRRNILF